VTASSPSKLARHLTQPIENIQHIEGYVAGLDEGAFLQDQKTRDAVERCLQRAIEALDRIKKQKAEHLLPGLPWGDIQGLGNRLRHEYDAIDGRQIWLTVKNDLPTLKENGLKALGDLQE
jgi:uncharacterized protein with HEPN domain